MSTAVVGSPALKSPDRIGELVASSNASLSRYPRSMRAARVSGQFTMPAGIAIVAEDVPDRPRAD